MTMFLALGLVTAAAFALIALHHIAATMLDAMTDADRPETQDDFAISMARWGHVQSARNRGRK